MISTSRNAVNLTSTTITYRHNCAPLSSENSVNLCRSGTRVLASLIETCKWHAVNPEAWLADVLARLVSGWPNRRLAELAPWAWKAAQAADHRAAA